MIGVSMMGLSGVVAAQSQPGWYFGLEGFYSDVEDIDGTLNVTTPETGTPNTCILPIDLLGLDLEALGLCVIGSNEVTTPGTSTLFNSSIAMDDGFGGGFSFGYLFDGGLRPELNLRYAENDVKSFFTNGIESGSNNASLKSLRLMANVWYDIDLGNFAPYFGGGIGMQNTELASSGTDADDDTVAYQAGGGIAYWFGNFTALSLDYRFISAEEPSFGVTDALTGVRTEREGEYKAHNIGASFRYAFGGQFADSDGDGVIDRKDKCPNTPEGVQVYSDGCPIDLDQDGVPDYLDKCPNTPPGSPVDSNGCPIDSDGDGVPDHLDECPGTPAGVAVDGKGCPVDADGDGVPDYLDKCPETAPGTAVDAAGCPIADSDGDGIPDHLDKCPNSDPSIKVGPDGCPLDSDGDGIPDHLDECPRTPPGLKVLPNGCALVGDCRTPRAGEAVDANGCALDQRFILRGVKFEFDSDKLTVGAQSILNDVADTLAAYPDVSVEVQGHTDSLGTDAYNLGLSERRAIAVKRYLTGRGVNGDRMRPQGYGESAPIADNNTEEGQEENRRVEFRVTP
ncbi:OmpA family protein [Panacagrimonas sp.]|uniref:OmpA family protein n=1 Tax=Panacagrimonas sp. TaxID=2480088 RepID=UPI003B52A806